VMRDRELGKQVHYVHASRLQQLNPPIHVLDLRRSECVSQLSPPLCIALGLRITYLKQIPASVKVLAQVLLLLLFAQALQRAYSDREEAEVGVDFQQTLSVLIIELVEPVLQGAIDGQVTRLTLRTCGGVNKRTYLRRKSTARVWR
jgi:hypothetical protein